MKLKGERDERDDKNNILKKKNEYEYLNKMKSRIDFLKKIE